MRRIGQLHSLHFSFLGAISLGWVDVPANEANLPRYQPLMDKNLRTHFENPIVRKVLFDMGLVDKDGHILDVDRNKSRLLIIEQVN